MSDDRQTITVNCGLVIQLNDHGQASIQPVGMSANDALALLATVYENILADEADTHH